MEKKPSFREKTNKKCILFPKIKRAKVKEKKKKQGKEWRMEKENIKLSRMCLETRKLEKESLASPQCVSSAAAWINSFSAALYIYRKVPLI